mgnify:CR=1 FL=1
MTCFGFLFRLMAGHGFCFAKTPDTQKATLHLVAFGNFPACFVLMLNPETRLSGSNTQDSDRIKLAILGCVEGEAGALS